MTLQGLRHDLEPVSACKTGWKQKAAKLTFSVTGSDLFHHLIDNLKTLSSGCIWMSYCLPFDCDVLQAPAALEPFRISNRPAPAQPS